MDGNPRVAAGFALVLSCAFSAMIGIGLAALALALPLLRRTPGTAPSPMAKEKSP